MPARISKKGLIQSLDPDSARSVLFALVNENPDLLSKVYNTAKRILRDVSPDDIASDVASSLAALDIEDLYSRSGKTRYGYKDPSDEAWEMFNEAIEPFIDEMNKYLKRGMSDVAKNYCAGIIKGIQRSERGLGSELSDWIPDAPGEAIESVYDEWKKSQPGEDEIAEMQRIIDEEDEE
ncbi:MAG: hypothetical protein LBL83_01060 [Clostridiales bacterium]|jgi:hypothetical protein|nr:hypothetical protein [Clostridiales bacterium]